MTSVLLSTPPAWLLSPSPWIAYVSIYAVLVASGISQLIVNVVPAFILNFLLAGLDGLLRGTGSCGMASAAVSKGLPAWSGIVLAPIATCGGGWLAQLLGIADGVPRAPSVLQGGVMGTLDVWGSMATAAIYLALSGADGPWTKSVKKIDSGSARAVAIIFFACLFAARVWTQNLLTLRNSARNAAIAKAKRPVAIKEKEEVSAESSEVEVEVLKAPAAANGTSAAKKRKNKKKKAGAH